MDRRDFLEQFRDRLGTVITESGLSRSAFATEAGMDRSTLSQLLSASNDRLPRVETLAAIAARWQVSIDWLLGLSQQGQLGANIVEEQISIRRDVLSAADEMLVEWQKEAIGYKIRYVPSTLPDLLRTEDTARYELGYFATARPEQAIEKAAVRLAYQRRPETDMEACSSLQSIAGFARGEGIWRGLDRDARRAQLDHMIDLVEELYPTFRWFLFDGLQLYSIPVTLFGPLRAAVYVGQMYMVFTSTEHIRALTQHFDHLIRGAVIQPTDVPTYLRTLRDEIAG
jgi:transcriptional regulator with XRE-family HTH domain